MRDAYNRYDEQLVWWEVSSDTLYDFIDRIETALTHAKDFNDFNPHALTAIREYLYRASDVLDAELRRTDRLDTIEQSKAEQSQAS